MKKDARLLPLLLLFLFTVLRSASADTPPFVHPGGWITAADIAQIRAQIAKGASPWAEAKDQLLAGGPDASYQPQAVASVTRGPGGVEQGGNSALQNDASNAYTLMIKWVATNDPSYGDAAIRIIDAWSAVLQEFQGHDARLAAGIYGNKLAQAAELAAYYKPDWPNKARAQKMFLEVFYPVIKNGASINWGTSCMAGIISMAVFCDNRDMYNQAVSAYEHGFPGPDGMAGVTQYIDDSGECAETGRDQPHPQGGMAHLLETAVTAWHQGLNLLTYDNNRLLLGLEYIAKYNLGNDVPYHPFIAANGKILYPNGVSPKGRGTFSPIYAMTYYYFARVGLDAPYAKQVLDSSGYSPEKTNNDHPGWGTLTFAVVPDAPKEPIPPAPTADTLSPPNSSAVSAK